MPPRPSEIAAQKRNAKKKEKVAARQVSSGAEVVTPDIADDIADSKLQWSSKKKALERKVWNDTTSNNRKRAPTVTELLSAPATKSVRKTLKAVEKTQKAVEGGGRERSSVASTLTSHNGVSVDTDDSASEYGISDSESNKSDGKVLGDQPFCDEAMIDTLHQSLFDGENSIGVQSHEDFVSVLDGNDEPELPIAMVALIATVIYAILMDWRSGNPPSSSQVKSFNATVYISVYKAHEATLTRIFEGGKKKYHALMARLYKAVCVSDSVLLPSGALSNFDYLDLSAMSED
ncbi:uncharacterized protein F5891DRAFT_1175321 [Suillus fuscotomentosus]|uniref:DUF6532 domain-containing protein n=1 Tax=Suillus fuscotomentosus TaxID=1912939 RepID=A0AAD4HFW7_9AGAM|nr:uncharacterized protein F5891DRAFT_1175321 [Suillus fuscotomentosus]KAG1896130.1 hypothetical protein F5891DRAFT_1175321 [Suillus fuscotomentosus]